MTRAKPKKRRKKPRVRIRIPKRTEASIEEAACAKILERWPDVMVRKLNGSGNRNWPDRLLLFPKEIVAMVEFKRPGEKLRPGQEWFINSLRQRGFKVFVEDSINDTLNHLAVYVMERGYSG